MNTLISVGTTAAYGLSLAATFVPNLFYANGLEPHQNLYYETSSAIIALVDHALSCIEITEPD